LPKISVGDPVPLRKKEWNPQFSDHVYCGQTAAWIKMPLGTEVALGPGNTVLDVFPAPAKGAQQSTPLFGAWLLWPRSPISATAELLSIFDTATDTVSDFVNIKREGNIL